MTFCEDSGGTAGCDGRLLKVEGFTDDDLLQLLTKLEQLIKEELRSVDYLALKRARGAHSEPQRKSLVRDFLKSLDQCGAFVPVMQTPLVVGGNRRCENNGLGFLDLRFIAAKQSSINRDDNRSLSLKALGAAIQSMTHDIKKPFTMVQSFANLIARTADPQHVQNLTRRHLPQITASIRQLEGMMADIAELNDETIVAPDPVSLRAVIKAVLSELEEALATKKNHSPVSTFSIANMVAGDELKLRRAIVNVLENAVEATPRSGQIWVATDHLNAVTKIVIGKHWKLYSKKTGYRRSLETFTPKANAMAPVSGLLLSRR